MNPDIYARTVRGKPVNPGVALYQAWESILATLNGCDANGDPVGQTLLGGDNYYGIGVVDDRLADEKPVLGLGAVGWRSVSASFVVNPKGEFQLRHLWGFKQRNRISNMTFLRWEHFRSSYQWFVDPTGKPGGLYRSGNWVDPVPYLQERILQATWTHPLWWRLELLDTGHWAIKPSRVVSTGAGVDQKRVFAEKTESVENYERLVQRRYRLIERDARIRAGEIKPRVRSTLTEAQREERYEKQMLAIMAHLNVQMPAKTTPLRRTQGKEASWQPSGCL